ncbi:MAG: pectin methylesterase [Clostridiales bacterium]|nr:pectin methylesterase [Clostridiales bacterium]
MIVTVAKDGTGDHTSLQAAVDAASAGDVISICPGVYEGRVIINRDGITIRGADADKCVITAAGCAKDKDENGKEKGTFLSWTMLVTGNDVRMQDITVRNDAGDGRTAGQAVAVYAAGDRDVWKNVRMIAHQDTLFCGPTMPKVQKDALPWKVPAGVESVGDCPEVHSRQYFENCFIRGDVDFIFGPFRCYFEKCTLYMNEHGGFYTAANTPENCKYGLVFHECLLTGEGTGYLGRPWRRYARTAFIDCTMDEHVDPRGFKDWDEERVVTERLCEYGTRGERSDLSLRHPMEGILSPEGAAYYEKEKVLDGWKAE